MAKSDRNKTRRLATVTSLEAKRQKPGITRWSKQGERPRVEALRPAEVLVPDYVEATKSRQFGQVLLFLIQERPGGTLSWRALMLDFLGGSIFDAPQLDGLEERDLRELQRTALAGLGGLDPAWDDGVPLVRLTWSEAQALMWEAWAVAAISGDESDEDFATRRLLRRWGVKAEMPGPLSDRELSAVTRKITGGLASPEGLMEVFRNAWAAGDWGLYYDLFLDPAKALGMSDGGEDGKGREAAKAAKAAEGAAAARRAPEPDISGRTDFIIDKIEEDILDFGVEDEDDEESGETLHILDVRPLPEAKRRAVAWVAYVQSDDVDEWQEEVDRLELERTPDGAWFIATVEENAWPGPILANETPFSVSADYALDRLAAFAFARFGEEADRAEREYFQSSAVYDLDEFPGYALFVDYFLFEWQVPGMWGTVAQIFAEEEDLTPRWRQAFRKLLSSRKSFFEVVTAPLGAALGGATPIPATPMSATVAAATATPEPAAPAPDTPVPDALASATLGSEVSFAFPLFADGIPPVPALNARPFTVRDLLDPTAPAFEVRALGDRRLLPEAAEEVVTGRVVEWLGAKYFTPAVMVVPSTMAGGVKSSLSAIFGGVAAQPTDAHASAQPTDAQATRAAASAASSARGLSRRRTERLAGSFERAMFLPALFSLAETNLDIPELRPRRRTALLEEAERLVADGFSLDASLYLKRILERYPEEPRALLALGEVEKNLGRIDDARAAFEKLLARDEANLEAACGLAELDLATGRSETATLVLEKAFTAAAARPRPTPVSEYEREFRARLRFALDMAVAQATLQERRRAENWAQTAARLLAGREKVEEQLGVLTFEAAISLLDLQAYRGAIELLEPLSKIEADRPLASQVLGVAYMRLGRYRKAALAYQAAAEHDPDNYIVWLGLADSRLALGHLRLAEEAYMRCLSLAPGQISALNNLGVTLLKRGQFFAAAELFRQAVEIAPDHVNANINLAVLLENEGRVEEAQRYVGHVLAVDPQNSAALELATRLRRRAARPGGARKVGAARPKGGGRRGAAPSAGSAAGPGGGAKRRVRRKEKD